MRLQVKVGVYHTKIPKRVLRTCVASRRNERGLGIHEETTLLSPWQWRFEVDRMQNRFASNVDMGPCQPARFWKKIALLREGCRIHWSAWSRARRKTNKRRAISRCGGVVLDRCGGGVARTGGWRRASSLFFLGKAGYVCLLSFLRGFFHVVEIGCVPSIHNIRSVSTMTTADGAVRVS